MENDETPQGSESLTIDQATAAYVKATTPAVGNDHAGTTAETDSDDTTDDELQASDEDVSDDDGETAEQDDAPEGEDDESTASEQGRFVADNARVRLPDGTITTVSELKRGSLREADYTRKTQETSALKQQTEAQSSALKQREQQIAERERLAEVLITSVVPSEPPPRPNPAMTDPNSPHFDIVGYNQQAAQYQNWMDWQGHLGSLTQAQQAAQAELEQKAAADKREKHVQEWTKAIEVLPDLKDPVRAKAFVDQSMAFVQAAGFSQQEAAEALAADHRLLPIVRDAMKWKRLQANKAKVPEKVEGRPAVLRGGKRPSVGERRASAATDALNTARKSGSITDVTAAYIATLNKG